MSELCINMRLLSVSWRVGTLAGHTGLGHQGEYPTSCMTSCLSGLCWDPQGAEATHRPEPPKPSLEDIIPIVHTSGAEIPCDD